MTVREGEGCCCDTAGRDKVTDCVTGITKIDEVRGAGAQKWGDALQRAGFGLAWLGLLGWRLHAALQRVDEKWAV